MAGQSGLYPRKGFSLREASEPIEYDAVTLDAAGGDVDFINDRVHEITMNGDAEITLIAPKGTSGYIIVKSDGTGTGYSLTCSNGKSGDEDITLLESRSQEFATKPNATYSVHVAFEVADIPTLWVGPVDDPSISYV